MKRDLEESLNKHNDKLDRPKIEEIRNSRDAVTTLILGDTHFPFVSEDALCAVYQVAEKLKPKRIIQCGDLYDMFSAGRFPRSFNIYTPEQEYRMGRMMAEAMWMTLGNICPEADRYQILGNHDVRPIKKLFQNAPELEPWFDITPAFTFDGVEFLGDYRQELFFDNFFIHHGYLSKLGDHRDATLMNCVVGHTHQGGVSFRNTRYGVLWELNAGYLGDPTSKALSYTPQKLSKWTHGVGVIDEMGPRFIAF